MSENVKYRMLHGCYWMLINVTFGYIVFYLAEYGYSAGKVGVLTASFAGLTTICQPILGRIADRSERFGWKPQIMILSAGSCIGFLLLFVTKQPLLVGLLFGVIILLVNCIQPTLNAACFYYQERGIPMDFGIARGIGSMAYAVMSSVLGYFTVKYGTVSVIVAGVVMMLVQLAVVASMPYGDKVPKLVNEDVNGKATESAGKQEKKETSTKGFWKKYPVFLLMVFGCILLITVHHFMTTYLLNIMEAVGGDSGNMGTALSIGAVAEIPMLFLVSRIVKKIPASTLLTVSGVAYIGKSLVFFLSGNVWMIYAAHLLQPFSYALYASATIYFANDCMSEEDKTTGQAFMTMSMAAGSLVGNLTGGWLIDFSGVKMMLVVAVVLSVIAAGVVGVSAVLYNKSKKMIRV